jgi:hypothetical protein
MGDSCGPEISRKDAKEQRTETMNRKITKDTQTKRRKNVTQSRKGAKVNQGNWWGEAPELLNEFAGQTGDDSI